MLVSPPWVKLVCNQISTFPSACLHLQIELFLCACPVLLRCPRQLPQISYQRRKRATSFQFALLGALHHVLNIVTPSKDPRQCWPTSKARSLSSYSSIRGILRGLRAIAAGQHRPSNPRTPASQVRYNRGISRCRSSQFRSKLPSSHTAVLIRHPVELHRGSCTPSRRIKCFQFKARWTLDAER
jgi:hypothetical protein